MEARDQKKMIKLLAKLKNLQACHTDASYHFSRLHMLIQLPSIFLSGISSVISFISTSYFVQDSVVSQKSLELCVGIITSLVVILTSMSTALHYSAKKESHHIAASSIETLVRKTEFELIEPDQENFVNLMEEQLLSIQSKLNFVMPQWITDKHGDKDMKFTKYTNDYQNAGRDIHTGPEPGAVIQVEDDQVTLPVSFDPETQFQRPPQDTMELTNRPRTAT